MAATLTTCVDRGPDWTKTQIIQIICLMNNTNKYIIVETWMKRLTLETNYHSKLRQGLNKHLNKKLVVPHKLPAKDRAIHYMVFLSSVVEIHVILPTHTPCFSNSMFLLKDSFILVFFSWQNINMHISCAAKKQTNHINISTSFPNMNLSDRMHYISMME